MGGDRVNHGGEHLVCSGVKRESFDPDKTSPMPDAEIVIAPLPGETEEESLFLGGFGCPDGRKERRYVDVLSQEARYAQP